MDGISTTYLVYYTWVYGYMFVYNNVVLMYERCMQIVCINYR